MLDSVMEKIRSAIDSDKGFTLPEGADVSVTNVPFFSLRGHRIGYSIRITAEDNNP